MMSLLGQIRSYQIEDLPRAYQGMENLHTKEYQGVCTISLFRVFYCRACSFLLCSIGGVGLQWVTLQQINHKGHSVGKPEDQSTKWLAKRANKGWIKLLVCISIYLHSHCSQPIISILIVLSAPSDDKSPFKDANGWIKMYSQEMLSAHSDQYEDDDENGYGGDSAGCEATMVKLARLSNAETERRKLQR